MRRILLIAAFLALAACGQTAPPSEAPAEEVASEAPSATEPAPPPAAEDAPSADDGEAAQPAPAPPPPPSTSTEAPQAAPDRSGRVETRDDRSVASGPSPSAPSIAFRRDRVLTPVLVELMGEEQRAPRQGGSAAVLLADPASAVGAGKNLVLCQALFRTFDEATSAEARIGVRPGAEGELELLRPIYWLASSVVTDLEAADKCPERLTRYDYPRSDRIGRKLGLVDAGPYLVIERHDLFENERVAAIMDLSRTAPAEIANAVRYFRDGFMQAGDVWTPQRFERTRARNDLVAFLGEEKADAGFLPRLVRATRQVGCPLTNLLDVCSEPG